jgi:hypothetical protein
MGRVSPLAGKRRDPAHHPGGRTSRYRSRLNTDVVMRISRYALFLAFPLLLVGCKGTEHIQGTPSDVLENLTVAGMQPYITRSLTPQQAVDRWGSPNGSSSAGVVVLIYNVDNGQKVSLGFPSLDGTIQFARVTSRTGESTDLQILP